MALTDFLSVGADLIGSAGDLYNAFRDPPKTPYRGGFRRPFSTNMYNFGGGQLRRTSDPYSQAGTQYRDVISALRARTTPGYGELTKAGLADLNARRQQALGNARQQFGRRGLLGASFVSDQLAREEQFWDTEAEKFRTAAWREEMQVHSELADKEYQSRAAEAQRDLAELQFAGSFLASVDQTLLSQAEVKKFLEQRQLAQQAASGAPAPGTNTTPGTTPGTRPAGQNGPRGIRPVQQQPQQQNPFRPRAIAVAPRYSIREGGPMNLPKGVVA